MQTCRLSTGWPSQSYRKLFLPRVNHCDRGWKKKCSGIRWRFIVPENEFTQERVGLAAFYRGLADSELEDLLNKQQTLTEPAKQELRAEVDRRGLRAESPAPAQSLTEIPQLSRSRGSGTCQTCSSRRACSNLRESIVRCSTKIQFEWTGCGRTYSVGTSCAFQGRTERRQFKFFAINFLKVVYRRLAESPEKSLKCWAGTSVRLPRPYECFAAGGDCHAENS